MHRTPECRGEQHGIRYVLIDRDGSFCPAFRAALKAVGVDPVRLPPKSPNLNAHLERFHGSIKSECLDRLVIFGETMPRNAVRDFLNHYHAERNHQGLENKIIAPAWYWNRIGRQCYPHATSILGLCDCGGSNSANQHLFKRDLQNLVNDIGIEIRIAHYPSYCSQYNPIERRFFPHVARACQGMLFDTLETAVRLMRNATTTTGLRTTVNVIRRACETGRKVARNFKATMTTLFDELLPKWNYRAAPQ